MKTREYPRFLFQEDLKILACLLMLIDHVGAVLFPRVRLLRIIGRLAFPIFCFQLAEGAERTSNPRKYLGRLALGAAVSEIPFDLALKKGLTWQHQSVMLTLVLAFCILWAFRAVKEKRCSVLLLLAALLCIPAAERLHTDYGSNGVLMVLIFALFRGIPYEKLWQTLALGCLCWRIGGFHVLGMPVEIFALLSLPLIWAYNGKKRWKSPAPGRAFYAFYPAHLALLALVKAL